MERSLADSSFNEQEKLVAKLCVLSKMQRGLECRTKCAVRDLIRSEVSQANTKMETEIVSTIGKGYDIGCMSCKTMFKEVARYLGVSSQKYKEIEEWVYKNETKM